MTGDRSQLINFVQKFLGTVKFKNDHVAKIMGYGDYKIGNVNISRVYFVEGLGHNLFYVGRFCDSHLEVAFCQHTCFIHNLDGVDLFTGSRGNNLYTLSLKDMMASSPICLLSKASKTKSWLWHRRLSHLNFGAINHLARQGLVRGLPKLKFKKDHLYSACTMVKSKKKSHKTKSEDANQEKLYLQHLDLYRPMRVESVNGKKYLLVIVDDYSRFTWVKCLRSNDEALKFIIKFLKMIQVRLKVPVHQAAATACYTKNGSIIRLRHGKTPYEILYNKLHDLSFLHVFGALCYPTNDNFDELMAMASEQNSSGPALNEMTPATISSGLVKKPSFSTPYVPPSRNDWDFLFQLMFDELLNPPPSVDTQAPEVIASIADVIPLVPAESIGLPSSTTVDQDAPSPSKSQTTPETQSSDIPQDVEEDILDIEVAHMGNDPLFGVSISEVTSAQSLSTDFFAPGPLPRYAGNPNNNNGWVEVDDYLLGELEAVVDEPMAIPSIKEVAEPVIEAEEKEMIAPVVDMEEDLVTLFGEDDDFKDDDFSEDDSKGVKEDKVWEVNEEWLMAPITPPLVPSVQPPSVYEVGGPSTVVAEGPSFPLTTPRLLIHPSVIEDLSTRLGNLGYEHRQMVKKVIKVSDVEVAAGVLSGRLA
uniref:Retrovirus-related Pol polyprotein from transposon TNT 1-94 n=1 Tax=Tanacetum cinerariifolium TaxID=118510 RepID=A0A6L2NCV4_TANCI|nr:retrovirus-related Pol polyprotein from transposon TNT 1-94 [Tanacetum cinerariifolium]